MVLGYIRGNKEEGVIIIRTKLMAFVLLKDKVWYNLKERDQNKRDLPALSEQKY